ncbi:MAG: hypothetical protein CMN44_04210 [SAR116 cluster bacterium]|nr:hypothetical protein [SAR116 cluster bacterium]
MIEPLIKRFNAKSLKHLVIIFVIFGISGTCTLIITEPIINLLKMNEIFQNSLILIFLRVIIIIPLYQIILLSIGYIFGEFNYFYNFEKKIYKKFLKKIK